MNKREKTEKPKKKFREKDDAILATAFELTPEERNLE